MWKQSIYMSNVSCGCKRKIAILVKLFIVKMRYQIETFDDIYRFISSEYYLLEKIHAEGNVIYLSDTYKDAFLKFSSKHWYHLFFTVTPNMWSHKSEFDKMTDEQQINFVKFVIKSSRIILHSNTVLFIKLRNGYLYNYLEDMLLEGEVYDFCMRLEYDTIYADATIIDATYPRGRHILNCCFISQWATVQEDIFLKVLSIFRHKIINDLVSNYHRLYINDISLLEWIYKAHGYSYMILLSSSCKRSIKMKIFYILRKYNNSQDNLLTLLYSYYSMKGTIRDYFYIYYVFAKDVPALYFHEVTQDMLMFIDKKINTLLKYYHCDNRKQFYKKLYTNQPMFRPHF